MPNYGRHSPLRRVNTAGSLKIGVNQRNSSKGSRKCTRLQGDPALKPREKAMNRPLVADRRARERERARRVLLGLSRFLEKIATKSA